MMSVTVLGKLTKMSAMVLGKPMKMMMAIMTMVAMMAMMMEGVHKHQQLVTMLRQQTWCDHLALELRLVFKTGRRASEGQSPVTPHNCRVGAAPFR
jgi:hypothetical protein